MIQAKDDGGLRQDGGRKGDGTWSDNGYDVKKDQMAFAGECDLLHDRRR